jgi:hypothetical protein
MYTGITGNFLEHIQNYKNVNVYETKFIKDFFIRRKFPELIANEIVSVQPMTGPTGLAFMKYVYDEREKE